MREPAASSAGTARPKLLAALPRGRREVALVAGVAAAYFVAGKVGLSLALVNASATAVWPPTGIAIAALLLLGYRAWPGVLAGAFLVNLATQGTPWTSLGIGVGNTLEGLAGAWLVNRYAGGTAALDRAHGVFKFALLAGLVATMVSATVGVTTLALGGLAPWSAYGAVWWTWWLGDAAGALVVAPPLLLWGRRPWPRPTRPVVAGAGAAVAALAAVGFLVFHQPAAVLPLGYPVEFLAIPLVVGIAYQLGPRAAATGTALLAALATWGTLAGRGPFAVPSPNDALLLLQGFLGVLSVTGLTLGALVAERRRVEADLRAAHDELEARVRDRTASLTGAVDLLRTEVAERQRAEARARASEKLLEEAQAISHLGSWEWDMAADRLHWSDELRRLCGLPPGEGIAGYRDFLGLLHPEDRGRVEEVVEEAARTGEPFSLEHRIVRPDGTVRWLHGRGHATMGPDGRPVRMAGTALDITERKDAELAVRRLAALVQSAPEAVFGVSLDGRIESWNPGAEALFGWTAGEAVGQPVTILIPPERMDEIELRTDALADAGHATVQLETERLHKDGTSIPVWLSFSPIHDGEGRVLGCATILTDLRERRRVEADRRSAEDRLRELDRLREMEAFRTTFLNMAAHELGTPLTPIKLQLDILQGERGRGLGQDQQRSLGILQKNVDRLVQLVGDILEASRLQSGRLSMRPMPVDLNALVAEAAESYQEPARRKGVRVEVRHDGPLTLEADPRRILQVVHNLLSNAWKFTPEGGTIAVETAASDGEALLRVRDTGPGLRQEDLPRLFQPFSQVHAVRSGEAGTGLGLFICRGIVELHGGRIWAESDGAGKGSTFVVALPLAAARAARPSEGSSPQAGANR